jgi:hypothetical protein
VKQPIKSSAAVTSVPVQEIFRVVGLRRLVKLVTEREKRKEGR